MSLKLNEPRNIRGVVSYKRSFGDLNEKHLNVAQAIGIRVLSSREEAEKMREQLQPITTNELYAVDSLTHSIPYLIPGAASLLDTIGHNFLDSLTAKGLNPNKIIVTSVLRTQDDVKRLRRRNGNASPNSAHFTERHSMSVGSAFRNRRRGWTSFAGCQRRYLKTGSFGSAP